MEIPAQRQHQLRALFAALPERSIVQLRQAFQHGRDAGDRQLPYDNLIAMLPVGNEPELPNPEIDLIEVFHPASLLLGESDIRPDRLVMNSLNIIWHEFSTDPAYADLMADTGGTPDPADARRSLAMWLRCAWEAEGGGFRFKELLGRRNGTKVPMIVSLLSYADEISSLIEDWPDEIRDLGEEILVPLYDLHALLIDVDCEITPWLMFLLYARLRRPQEILRAVTYITRQTSDMMLLMTNMKILPDVMVGEAEDLLMRIAEPMTSMDQQPELEQLLQRFAGIVFGSGEEFDIRPHGQWGKSLANVAGRAQQVWKRKLDTCTQMLERVTPRNRLKSFLGGEITSAKTSVHLDTNEVHLVELALFEIRIAFSYAGRLGIASLRDKYARKIISRLNEQVDNLIDLMADPGDVDPHILQEHFDALVRLTRAYHGSKEAEVLQRRGAAIAA